MDNEKARVPAAPQGEPGDIDIFLFSNGEALAPPRKYHLTAQELHDWDSTLNFLARAQYGFLYSSINLYTIDGKKVETPLELANNNAYVAVETKDNFQPGGYDQYLMKASKSWIKRYGSFSSGTSIKEKESAGTALQSEKTTNDAKLAKVKEVKEIEEIGTELKTTAFINTEINDTNVSFVTTKLPNNNDAPKLGDKKKTTPSSTIVRKNKSNVRTKGENHLNVKDKPPTPSTLKRRPGSPPTKKVINKVTPARKESLVKSHYSPGKRKQNVNKNNDVPGSDFGPECIVPDKLSGETGTRVQQESISNGNKELKQDVDQVAKHEKYESITDTLETIKQNVNDCYDFARNKQLENDSVVTKSLSTEIHHGDVIKLRLNIEVTHGENKDNEDKSLPLMNNELWSLVIQEKCSQVNTDEIVLQKETLKGVLEDLQNNKVATSQKNLIMHCVCCNNYFYETVALNEEIVNNQSNTIKKVRSNKDYIVLLPCKKPDDDLIGCKCDEAVPKSDKTVQTSIIFETTEYSKVAAGKQTVDQAADAPRGFIDVKTVSRSLSHICLCDTACGTSETLLDNKVHAFSPPLKGRRTVDQYPAWSNTIIPRTLEVSNNNNMYTPPPIENPINCTECLLCTNKPTGMAMLNKSTQTDYYCFLLEARRKADGHYSFHLPPLQMVKLY